MVTSIDARAVGVAAWRLGAGRERQGQPVSAGAGVRLHVAEGDRVATGETVAELLSDDAERIPVSREALSQGIVISDRQPESVPTIIELISP